MASANMTVMKMWGICTASLRDKSVQNMLPCSRIDLQEDDAGIKREHAHVSTQVKVWPEEAKTNGNAREAMHRGQGNT